MRSTTGHTFGGYASAPWNSSAGGPINAAGCFLFLVENPHGDAPTCFEYKNDGWAMYAHSGYDPTFGGGSHDLFINISSDRSPSCSSYTSFPNSYIDTLGRGNATFTGAFNFTPEDYEVWAAAT